MRVAIGADHAGYGYKTVLAEELAATGYEVSDLGTNGPESVDYPDFAAAVAEAVARGEADRGILVCGSAVGVCVTANKVPGVRAGVCHDTYSAHQGVEHDDMNVLCMGERVIGIEVAREVVASFLRAEYHPEERFERRLRKLKAVEATYMRSETGIPIEE
ncbi:MAG: ribose 5-phosphate isomerase B [Gemmatimonadota bacterium]|nr:ribose 5-phosphate isomerase B [Gemmatimonadota bacterium]